MTTTSFNVENKGSSTSRSSFFYGNENAYWKIRMIRYLQSIDYDFLLSIKNGPQKPFKIENNITISKSKSENTDGDKKLSFMDTKAMNTLYCALSRS